jgi:hypothetical protein
MTATDVACLAISSGWRVGSLMTNVVNRIRSVTAPMAGMSAKGSMNGLSSRNSRVWSGENGYFESDSSG